MLLRFCFGTMKAMASVIPYMQANRGKFLQFTDSAKCETSAASFAYGMSLWERKSSQSPALADFIAYLSGRCVDMVGYWLDVYFAKEKLDPVFDSIKDDESLYIDVWWQHWLRPASVPTPLSELQRPTKSPRFTCKHLKGRRHPL